MELESTELYARDPVCGMEVDPQRAPGTTLYRGRRFYFCSEPCKRAFDADPERYLGAVPPPHAIA